MDASQLITRQQYLANPGLHHRYWSQFVTRGTLDFICSRIGIEKLKASKDGGNFSDIGIDPCGGGWVWDFAPVNSHAMLEAGECSPGIGPSLSAITCTAKAAALILVNSDA